MSTQRPETQKNKKEISYLALGDSYTKGESVQWLDNYPNQLADALKDSLLTVTQVDIIAQTGWRTDDLKAAIAERQPKPHDLVTLLIGVNNFYQNKTVQSFEPEFENLLLTAIDLANGNKNKVFVISIPDYGYTPFGADQRERISEGIQKFNDACQKIALKHGVSYLYITDITQKGLEQPNLVASDGLHPSALAYKEFVEKTAPYVVKPFLVR